MNVQAAFGLLLVAGCGGSSMFGTLQQAATEAGADTCSVSARCPVPMCEDNGGHCALLEDATIDAPLELGSFTKLNCKGHRLLPQAAGVDGPIGVYAPSVPEVAVALIGTREAKLQNCILGSPEKRFDFGVAILAAKADANGRNKILSNEMHVRAKGVLLLSADDNEISDNNIEWDGSAVGIHVNRDSDRNHIVGNTLTSSARPLRLVRDVPGIDAPDGGGGDIGVFQADPLAISTLVNVVIGKRLLQFPLLVSPEGEPMRIEDTVTEFNTITLPGPHTDKSPGGIITAVLMSRTTVRGNTVSGGRPGIRFSGGGAGGTPNQLPGTCQGDASRYCVTDDDCNLAGFDDVSLGPCQLGPIVSFDSRALGALVEGNTLYGPFGVSVPAGTPQLDCALGPFGGTVGAVVRDNRIFAAGSFQGIVVAGEGLLESSMHTPNSGAIVTRNIIDGAKTGLSLRQQAPIAPFFGARISENDIINSTTSPVGSFGTYTLASELSVDAQGQICPPGAANCRGNYWQHDAAPGFRATDTTNPLIRDSNPFCQAVAALGGVVPPTCP
jgi:hypothetical protein